VNSQSGKGGVGWVLENHGGIRTSRERLAEFAVVVQGVTEARGTELAPGEIVEIWERSYGAAPSAGGE